MAIARLSALMRRAGRATNPKLRRGIYPAVSGPIDCGCDEGTRAVFLANSRRSKVIREFSVRELLPGAFLAVR